MLETFDCFLYILSFQKGYNILKSGNTCSRLLQNGKEYNNLLNTQQCNKLEPTSFPKALISGAQLRRTMKRKYRFANRWNCSNKFLGKKLHIVYFVVFILKKSNELASLKLPGRYFVPTYASGLLNLHCHNIPAYYPPIRYENGARVAKLRSFREKMDWFDHSRRVTS